MELEAETMKYLQKCCDFIEPMFRNGSMFVIIVIME